MSEKLTQEEFGVILESLEATKVKFENYEHYPSPEFKRARVEGVRGLIAKIRQLKKEDKSDRR